MLYQEITGLRVEEEQIFQSSSSFGFLMFASGSSQ
jgi:hypothetical protein